MAPVDFEGFTLPRLRAGSLCLDFVNTVDPRYGDEREDYLTSYEALVRWGHYTNVLNKAQADGLIDRGRQVSEAAVGVLARALVLREALDALFEAIAEGVSPADDALAVLNPEFSRAMSHLQVQKQGTDFKWEWNEEALDTVLWAVARSAAELLVAPELDRLRICRNDDCRWMFLDMSKNRSRRWCSMDSCGNVVKQRRHQHKIRIEAE